MAEVWPYLSAQGKNREYNMELFKSLNKLVLETLSKLAKEKPGSVKSMLNIEERSEALFADLTVDSIARLCRKDMPFVVLDSSLLKCGFEKLLTRLEGISDTTRLVDSLIPKNPDLRSSELSIINSALITSMAICLKMDGGIDRAIMTTGASIEDAKALRDASPTAWARIGVIDVPLFKLRMSEHAVLHRILCDRPCSMHLSRYLTS